MHKIIFRADAGRDIGYGHFIRSLALADMLKEDFECIMYTQAPTPYQIREASGICRLEALPADDTRFQLFLDTLNGDETVVLDNYFYGTEYQQAIRAKGCTLAVIYDLHDRQFCADIVINPCLGPRWAILRKPFLEQASESPRSGCVVAFGGSDQLDLSSGFAALLAPEREVTILAGEMWQGKVPEGVKVVRSLSAQGVAALLRGAEDVYCSASSICYEALACGAKVHAGWYVDNQKEFYALLVAKGLIDPLGDLSGGEIPVPGEAPAGDPDFSGVPQTYKRVFEALALKPTNYVDMSPEQSRKVWEARNSDEVRMWMTNPEPFSFQSHLAFVESLKSRTDRLYYAFFDGDEFAGSCDIVDIEGGLASRGLFVSREMRGRGVAAAMDAYIDCVAAGMGVHTLTAEVLKTNGRSVAYHAKAGYIADHQDDRYQYYTKNL